MALFDIKFRRRISGYGGPGSSWATEHLYLEAASNREANKFFKTLITDPDGYRMSYGLFGYELGTWYRAIPAVSVDASRYHMFSVFKPKSYTQAELTEKFKEREENYKVSFQQEMARRQVERERTPIG